MARYSKTKGTKSKEAIELSQISSEEILSEEIEAKRGNLFFPLLLITFGIILILNNSGVLPWRLWDELLQFWPLLLVIAGLRFILGGSRIGNLVYSVTNLLLLFLIVFYSLFASRTIQDKKVEGLIAKLPIVQHEQSESQRREFSISEEDFPSIQKQDLAINLNAGRVTISDNQGSKFFSLEADFTQNYREPVIQTERVGDTLKIFLEGGHKKDGIGKKFSLRKDKPFYEIILGKPDLKIDMNIHVGTGTLEATLNDLNLDRLDLNLGSGDAEISLLDKSIPKEKIILDVETGSAVLTLPRNIGLRVTHSVGMGSINIDSQFLKGRGSYQIGDYDVSGTKLDMDIEVGTGTVVIKRI